MGTCIYSSLSLWSLCLSRKNRASSQRPSKWAGVYTQPVQLQPCRHRHLRATLCCLLQCAWCWLEDLYMLTYTPCLLRCLQKAKFTQIFTTEKLGLNHFESLRPYQVCPLGPLEGSVLQLKTGLRATSIFNNMPSAAELCQTSTRNTPHLFSSYSSHIFQPLP